MSEAARRQSGAAGRDADASAESPDLCERVLRYFREHASAMDSVDGIARFWVGQDRSVVENCLADLCRSGLLQKRVITGTEFYSLPQKSLTPETAPRDAERNNSTRAAAPRGRILVVDDDDSVREFLVACLSEEGHSVAAARDGRRAIAMCEAEPFDLVVTDLMMPRVSGMEVLKAVKRTRPSTEVVVVTAHASLDAAVDALRHGAYDFLTKPIDDVDLLHRSVERALERHRLATENRLLVEKVQLRNRELQATVARLAAVNEISNTTTRILDLKELYDSIVRMLAQHLKVRRISILLSGSDPGAMSVVASLGISDERVLSCRVPVGEGIAGGVAAAQAPLLVPDIEKSALKNSRGGGRYATDSFMITPLTISYPISYRRKRVGVINVADKISGDPFTEQDMAFLSTVASQAAVAIENARLVRDMEDGYLGVLVTLVRGVEDAHSDFRRHSLRVTELVDAVADEMGLAESRRRPLLQAASLHEVGRLSAPTEMAGRDGTGSGIGAEWDRAAVMDAERILAPIASLHAAREIILHSADRFDATPVPFGADRPGIPIESRILAVCEDFVRLTSANENDARRRSAALQALKKIAGGKLDPEVVGVLCRIVDPEGGR